MRFSFASIRLTFAVSLLFSEAMLLSLLLDAPSPGSNAPLAILLAHSGSILRWLIVAGGLFTLFLALDIKQSLKPLLAPYPLSATFIATLLHLVVYIGFFVLTVLIAQQQTASQPNLYYLWPILLGLTSVSWLFIVTSFARWHQFLSQQKAALLGAAACGLIIAILSFSFKRFWGSMTEFTLGSSKTLLSLFYQNLEYDVSQKLLGVDQFTVTIAPVCSGIEGAVLAVSIAAVYLYMARHTLKFPQALILLPLACGASIALNVMRIAALIAIGAEISPAIAIGGFHSIAGWITAILVALLIVFVFASWQWIHKVEPVENYRSSSSEESKLAQAILIPFVIVTGVTLLGGIFTSDLDYTYPFKVVLALGVLHYFWKTYRFQIPDRILESISVGLLAGIIWVYTMPTDFYFNESVSSAFAVMPLWLLIAWGFFRLLGFWFVAPIIEELVFRVYLLNRFSSQTVSTTRAPNFNLTGFFVSSLLFGLLHQAWLAGTLAGLLFAFARYRSQSITSSIFAHASANILVTFWALTTQNWSLI